MLNVDPTADLPLSPEDFAAMAERLERIPIDELDWVVALYRECQRAREAEAQHAADALLAADNPQTGSAGTGNLAALPADAPLAQDMAQLVLDAAEWLRTLWDVGYMGAGQLPAQPRSQFPMVEVEDVLHSALFARIRQGRRPLPFPPPTRWGMPWHEVVETHAPQAVEAQLACDESGAVRCATIEGCPAWDVLAVLAEGAEFRVQHQGKGPVYRLRLNAADSAIAFGPTAELVREAPEWTRDIVCKQRAGLTTFILEWPLDDGRVRQIPLRAATPERAETEASHWIARQHPERYGRVAFAHRAE